MTQTDFVAMNMVAELFQSMGTEIAIFAISMTLAAMWRGNTVANQGSACQKTLSPPPSKADSPKRKVKQDAPSREEAAAQAALTRKLTSIIECADKRQCGEAVSIYAQMKKDGETLAIKNLAKTVKKRPVDIYAALLQCAGNLGRPDLVETVLDDVNAAGIQRPTNFYETTMKVLAAKKCYKGALAVYARMEADGLEATPVTLSCLISFAVELGESDRAICFFERLAASSTPTIRAYMTILRVYSKKRDWAKSLAIVRDMQRLGVPIDNLIINIVLSTGVSARELQATKALLDEFAQIKLADAVSYNTVLNGFAKQKNADQALTLLAEMCAAGLQPNTISFNTVIDAAIRCERDADAWRVLALMINTKVYPDKFTCNTLMKGFQTGATAEKLTAILDILKEVAVNKDAAYLGVLFRDVIEAIVQVNDPALTAKAISQMREQQVMQSPQEHQRLLRLLMQNGRPSSNAPWRSK